MNVIALTPDNAQEYKPVLGDLFKQFVKSGVLAEGEIWRDILESQRQGFVLTSDGEVKAVVLTRIADDEAKSLVVTHATGKDRHLWQHLFPVLLDWGKAIGCTRVEAITRPGWKRILEKFGLKQTHVVLEMEL